MVIEVETVSALAYRFPAQALPDAMEETCSMWKTFLNGYWLLSCGRQVRPTPVTWHSLDGWLKSMDQRLRRVMPLALAVFNI